MDVSNTAILFVPCCLHPICTVVVLLVLQPPEYTIWFTMQYVATVTPGTFEYRLCQKKSHMVSKKKTVSHAPLWLLNPLLGESAPSTYIQTQQNTGGPELRSCVQSSSLTAGTVRWHLYYVPWGVLKDRTSICFLSLLPLQWYWNQANSPIWQKRTWFRETMQPKQMYFRRESGWKCILSVLLERWDARIWLRCYISTFTISSAL